MSELMNRFEVCSKISEEIKQKIRIFHVFKGFNVFYITSDDEVFGFGYNQFGCCGLGHNSVVNEPQIITELYHKNIQQFFIGETFILGLSIENQVYGWGFNSDGKLGRGYSERYYDLKKYFVPEIIEFSSESVIQLSCGAYHSLALTDEGKVYGWGSNKYGQIGCGKQNYDKITSPLHLDIFPQFSVKLILCSDYESYVLTNNGLVYSWGWNRYCCLGHELGRNECVFEPKPIMNIRNVVSICHSRHILYANTYFLTNDKELYFCGYFNDENNHPAIQKLPKLLNIDLKLTSLHSISNSSSTKSTAFNEENIFEFFANEIKETHYNSYFEYYSKECQISYKTIHIKSDQTFDGNDLKDLQNYIKNFEKGFIICKELGSGGFGTVYKVKDRLHKENFAVKKVPLNG